MNLKIILINKYTRKGYKTLLNFRLRLRYTWLKHFSTADLITFQCNICGRSVTAPRKDVMGRETPSCCYCGSTLRFRSIIHVLSLTLFNESRVLKNFKGKEKHTGIGMSDMDIYALPLAKKLHYTNTFYHTEPYLDICDVNSKDYEKYDFIISSDVFEHVPPPVEKAFHNMYRLLKPGGVCIFTVPYTQYNAHVEHFPDLFEYEIKKLNGKNVLINTTRNGTIQHFNDLRFHGGEGATLEMRCFSLTELKRYVDIAGFKEFTLFDKDLPEYGIIWDNDTHKTMSMKRAK